MIVTVTTAAGETYSVLVSAAVVGVNTVVVIVENMRSTSLRVTVTRLVAVTVVTTVRYRGFM